MYVLVFRFLVVFPYIFFKYFYFRAKVNYNTRVADVTDFKNDLNNSTQFDY